MAQNIPIPPLGFDDLSIDEKVDYVQSLWDLIAAKPEEVPIPDWHHQLLKERLASYRASPNEGTAWEEIRDELLRKLRNPEMDR
ncbi:MAG: addiction module protein [Acidobacteriota bacterium]